MKRMERHLDVLHRHHWYHFMQVEGWKMAMLLDAMKLVDVNECAG